METNPTGYMTHIHPLSHSSYMMDPYQVFQSMDQNVIQTNSGSIIPSGLGPISHTIPLELQNDGNRIVATGQQGSNEVPTGSTIGGQGFV